MDHTHLPIFELFFPISNERLSKSGRFSRNGENSYQLHLQDVKSAAEGNQTGMLSRARSLAKSLELTAENTALGLFAWRERE